jgi:hypothetical protein
VAVLIANGISFQLATVTKESIFLAVVPLGAFGLVLYFATIIDRWQERA